MTIFDGQVCWLAGILFLSVALCFGLGWGTLCESRRNTTFSYLLSCLIAVAAGCGLTWVYAFTPVNLVSWVTTEHETQMKAESWIRAFNDLGPLIVAGLAISVGVLLLIRVRLWFWREYHLRTKMKGLADADHAYLTLIALQEYMVDEPPRASYRRGGGESTADGDIEGGVILVLVGIAAAFVVVWPFLAGYTVKKIIAKTEVRCLRQLRASRAAHL